MSEVKYAGSAENAPSPDEEPAAPTTPPPPQPETRRPQARALPRSDEAAFQFLSRQRDLTLYVRDRGFTPICTAPCDGTLPEGAHQLALSLGTGRPLALPQLTRLPGRSTLHGSYVSRKETRVAGWVIFGTSLGLGTLLTLVGLSQGAKDCLSNNCKQDNALTIMGVATALGGGTLGLVLGLQFDEATLTVSAD
jgi:hypothetical protein